MLRLLVGGWWWREAKSLIQGLLKTHILYTWLWEHQPWGWVRLSDWVKETQCCKKEMEIYFYLVLWFFIFYLLFITFYVFNFSRIAKWWWLPWVSAVGLVRESPRVPIAEAPATWSSCNNWGKMREGGEDDDKGMVIVSLRVCGVWVEERCWVPWGTRLF